MSKFRRLGNQDLQKLLKELFNHHVKPLIKDEFNPCLFNLMHIMENAYYEYVDNHATKGKFNGKYPDMKRGKFVKFMILSLPITHKFRNLLPDFDKQIDEFRTLNTRVDVNGTIIVDNVINPKKIVLVKPVDYNNNGEFWTLPGGKRKCQISVNGTMKYLESKKECAVRETKEEIGYHIIPFSTIQPIEHCIKQHKIIDGKITNERINDRVFTYFIGTLHLDEKFDNFDEKEISDVRWFDISEIPLTKNQNNDPNFISVYMVGNIVKKMKKRNMI